MFQVIQERKTLLSDVTSKPPFQQTEEDISISEWTSNRILQSATSDSLVVHLLRGTTPVFHLGGPMLQTSSCSIAISFSWFSSVSSVKYQDCTSC
jgi:hypothetical protein